MPLKTTSGKHADPHKGRGAGVNPEGRFENEQREAFVAEEIANYADEQIRDSGWPREACGMRISAERLMRAQLMYTGAS